MRRKWSQVSSSLQLLSLRRTIKRYNYCNDGQQYTHCTQWKKGVPTKFLYIVTDMLGHWPQRQASLMFVLITSSITDKTDKFTRIR